MIGGIGAATGVNVRTRIACCLDLDQTSRGLFVPAARNKGILPHLGFEAGQQAVSRSLREHWLGLRSINAIALRTVANLPPWPPPFLGFLINFGRLLTGRD
jgi:hypothetical protein